MSLAFFIEIIFITVICGFLSICDLRKTKIPLIPVYAALLLQVIYQLIFNLNTFWLYLISVLIFSSIYILTKILSKNKLGTGDIFFGILQGLCILPEYVWICLVVEVLAAALFVIIKWGRKRKPKAFAFVPFMSLGLIVSLLFQFKI